MSRSSSRYWICCALLATGTPSPAAEETPKGPDAEMSAFAGSEDGRIDLRRSLTGRYDDPVELGRQLAQILLEDGAADLGQPSTPAQRPPEPVS